MKAETYRKKIVEQMESLGTYKEQFSLMIDTLAQILEYKDRNRAEWKKNEGLKMVMEYTNRGGETNLTKSPYYVNDLQYNEQILKYLGKLGLNPVDARRMGVTFDDGEEDELSAFSN